MNTGASWPTEKQAAARVLEIQTKLHRWTTDDPNRRFRDIFNLVCDPAFLLVAWRRVRGNKGARSAGVDSQTAYSIEAERGEQAFLLELRADLKARAFHPLPVRERLIPKPGGKKRRRLGIPTVRDRVVQAALKLVLEPIFEADCAPRGAVTPKGGGRPLRPTVAAGGQKLRAALAWRCRSWVGAALTT